MHLCAGQRGERERLTAEGADPDRHTAHGSFVRRTANSAKW